MDASIRQRVLAVAVTLAMGAEGLRQVAYYDPPGVLTVCYGSTTDVEKGKRYSLAECKGRLQADMLEAVETVERCVPGAPEGVAIAFSDAVYNLGPKIACDKEHSTAARLLAQGHWADACYQLRRWNKAVVHGVSVPLPGLTKRRAKEEGICLG